MGPLQGLRALCPPGYEARAEEGSPVLPWGGGWGSCPLCPLGLCAGLSERQPMSVPAGRGRCGRGGASREGCLLPMTQTWAVGCGPFSLLCPSSLPRAGILGSRAVGGLGFCSLSEPQPAPGRCHLPHCKAGLGMCRDRLAQLGGGVGREGCSHAPGKGAAPDSPGFITAVTWWEQGRGVRPQPAHLFLAATRAGLSFLGCSFPV